MTKNNSSNCLEHDASRKRTARRMCFCRMYDSPPSPSPIYLFQNRTILRYMTYMEVALSNITLYTLLSAKLCVCVCGCVCV